MTEQEKQEILIKAKDHFREKVAARHIVNTIKCVKIKDFKINPFLHTYLAQYGFGDSTPESLAKALVYPRVLGTSINTSFGNFIQGFCNDVLESYASVVQGIDIEFVDALDGRKKYCQLKAGPNTINSKDVAPIIGEFNTIRNLARANRMTDFNPLHDCVICIIYGTRKELSGHYKAINKEYPVFIGQEFWHRLTGDAEFYDELIAAFVEVASESNGVDLINSVVAELADKIRATL